MKILASIAHRADAWSARLNDGLAAVALVLALLIAITVARENAPALLLLLQPSIDPETGLAIGDF